MTDSNDATGGTGRRGGRRFTVGYPENWDELTDDQKRAAAREMARSIQRQVRQTDDRPIALFHSRDDRGTRSLYATRLPDGRLKIEGQDLGPAVAAFGPDFTEYEWDWIVAAADVPRIAEVLGRPAGSDPIAALRSWTSAANGRDPGQQLKDAGLDVEFWSRIGS